MNFIRYEIQNRVGVITMDYKKENRLNPDMMAEFMETLDAAESDAGVSSLVVTGADPKFFCNGLDLEWLMSHISQMNLVVEYLTKVNALYKRICVYPKPVVAAINGHVFGGGVFLAAYMDFRLMREDRGWLCLPEIDVNIPLLPAMSAVMREVCNDRGFRSLYYTGKRVGGAEAVEIGFADQAVSEADLLPKSLELAAMLGKKKTSTYAEMKRGLRGHLIRIIDEVDPDFFIPTLKFSMGG